MIKTIGQTAHKYPVTKPQDNFSFSLADNKKECQHTSYRLIKSPPILYDRQAKHKGLEVMRKVIFFIDEKLK